MGRVEFFDHLDAGAAVLGDLVNVRALHEPETDIGVPKAVGRAPVFIAVEFELLLSKHIDEQLDVRAGEDRIGRFGPFRIGRLAVTGIAVPIHYRLGAIAEPFVGTDSAGHAHAVADTALAANLDLQDFVAAPIVRYDLHVAVLKISGLVRPHAGIGHEQHIVVKLLGMPLVAGMKRLARPLARGLVELLVLLVAEPGAVSDLALGLVWRRKVRQVCEPAVAQRGLEDLAERHDLVVNGAARRWLVLG